MTCFRRQDFGLRPERFVIEMGVRIAVGCHPDFLIGHAVYSIPIGAARAMVARRLFRNIVVCHFSPPFLLKSTGRLPRAS
jgi:hypothetical protein